MTSTDRNDLMPAQEKLEWVTPKISLMEADKTAGAKIVYRSETSLPTGDAGTIFAFFGPF